VSDCRKLTTYFGERARADGAFLADALIDVYARHALQTSLVLRGIAGFGARHQSTDRLLTMSEDLPLAAVAVDERERIEAALADVRALPRFTGLITLERARLLTSGLAEADAPAGPTKLTVYLGRQERAAGRPADDAVVELLHRRGIAGATVLLGVDGTARGVRERARFFARNAEVPLMVIAIGDGDRIAAVLPELGALLPRPLITLEPVQLCKRDGRALATPRAISEQECRADPTLRQKLMIYASEQSRHAGRPLHRELVRALRGHGAAGATVLRGIWGYHDGHRPHGDSFWQLRRRVPTVTIAIDTPSRIQRLFAVVDRITDEAGLVTCEACHVVGQARGSGRSA
jgi:PII-like signaling protein